MRKILLIIIAFINLCFCYSQNDTLYLEKEYVMLGDVKYNQKDVLGQKSGEWILYEITEGNKINLIESDGDLWSSSEAIYFIYRPLEIDEYNGISKMIYEKVNAKTMNIECSYNIVYNRIPKNCYYLKGQGQYYSDKKIGKWTYYHENGVISKSIFYEKGIPNQSFKIYRDDKSIMMIFDKYKGCKWKVSRYSREGLVINNELMNVADFKEIF